VGERRHAAVVEPLAGIIEESPEAEEEDMVPNPVW
jgi:hypothetical protein